MKRCSRCKELLPLDSFSKNRSKRDGLQNNCRQCQREYVREHYRAEGGYYLAKAKVARAVWRARARLLLDELKSVECPDCGGTFAACAMDFDHVLPGKLFNLSRGPRTGRLAMLAEAAKCEIVCANCHRLRTLRRSQASAHSSVG